MRHEGLRRRLSWYRRDPEAGSTLIEFVVSSLVLFSVLFGIIEFGLVFSDRITIANAAQAGARVGTGITGVSESADVVIINAVEGAVIGGFKSQPADSCPRSGRCIAIAEVWIYKADANGEPVGASTTNVYRFTPTPDPLDCDWTPCPDPAFTGLPPSPWVPATRDVRLDASGLDRLGVRVFYRHAWITAFTGLNDRTCDPNPGGTPTNCFTTTAILRMEPQE